MRQFSKIFCITSYVFVGILLSSCGKPSALNARKTDIAVLPKCFAVLERLQVQAYRNQDWCKNIVYKRGKFSKNTESTCNLFEGTPLPFDAQAQKDFDSVAQTVAKTGVSLYYIDNLSYRADGTLVGAAFHLAAGPYTYVYAPGYKSLPLDMPNERKHTRINDDWYYIWEDWN